MRLERLDQAFDDLVRDDRLELLKRSQEDWLRLTEGIGNSLTDALLRGFESGADFAQNFVDTLRNMFRTLVLRPVIQAIVAPVAGGMASLIPGQAQAGGLNIGSLFGGGGGFDLSSLLGAGGSSMLGYGGMSGLFSGAGGIFGAGAIGNSFALSGCVGRRLGCLPQGLTWPAA